MKIKKVYNGFMAFLLLNGVATVFACPFMLSKSNAKGNTVFGIITLILIAVLITFMIHKRSPKGFFWKNWFSCLWTGFKIECKIVLCFTIFLIPVSARIATGCYYTGYDDMGREIWLKHIENDIYEDASGNRYKMK